LAGVGVTKFLAACERVGRDPASMRKCAQALVVVTDDADRVAKARAGAMAERTIVGSIDQIAEEVGDYVDLGFDEFIIPDWAFAADLDTRHGQLVELFAALTAAHG